jgi:tetratricopeptide (TPR) repeat protein
MGKLAKRLNVKDQAKAAPTATKSGGTLAQRLGVAKASVNQAEDKEPASADPVAAATQAAMDFDTAKKEMAAYIERLKEIDDIDARQPIKAEMVKRFMPLVDDYIQGGKRYPNSVAVQVLIYLFDLGDIAQALPLALHLVKQGIHRTPNNFKSNLATFVCDAMSDWAAKKLGSDSSALPYMAELAEAVGTDQSDTTWDLKHMVRAKVLAIAGKHEEQFGDKDAALALYESAMEIDKNAGVKKRRDNLKKR